MTEICFKTHLFEENFFCLAEVFTKMKGVCGAYSYILVYQQRMKKTDSILFLNVIKEQYRLMSVVSSLKHNVAFKCNNSCGGCIFVCVEGFVQENLWHTNQGWKVVLYRLLSLFTLIKLEY